jgi:hypothetical protein
MPVLAGLEVGIGGRSDWIVGRSSQLRDSAGLQRTLCTGLSPLPLWADPPQNRFHQSTDGCQATSLSFALQAVPGAHTGLGVVALRPGTEGSTLGPIQHRTTEVGIGNPGLCEAALHQHRVTKQGS